ncbi:MAG: hypothetical protein IPM23_23895 [Candidatus Melainabacteria bacterium]|nr:hypothetical protein [Candidatus Melainabacteria bacterium]
MLVLPGVDGSLTIDDGDPAWCVCFLKTEGRELNLGAECLQYIKEHLVSALLEAGDASSNTYEGLTLVGAGSLSPLRISLYIGINGNQRILFVQDDQLMSAASPGIIARLTLRQEDVQKWLRQLS